MIDEGDNGSGVRRDGVYISNREEVVLALLSDSYSELDTISVSVSGPSSCPILHCLLTTFLPKERVYNFDLRRPFYSKQDFKNACCSPA